MTRSGNTRRAFPGEVHATVADAGVSDQEDNTCRNGTPRCPGPNANVPALPCSACFFEEDSDEDTEQAERGDT